MQIGVARMALKSLDYRLLLRLGNVNNSESAQNVHARVRGRQFGQKWSRINGSHITMTLRVKHKLKYIRAQVHIQAVF